MSSLLAWIQKNWISYLDECQVEIGVELPTEMMPEKYMLLVLQDDEHVSHYHHATDVVCHRLA
eukprot:m.131174 g.131174  ORF g.131174 m.131174 type:complete len:63 (+) comp15742_c3_seq1:71-259(+)